MKSEHVTSIGELVIEGNLDLSKINTNDHGKIGGWEITDNRAENKETSSGIKLEDIIRIISFIRSKYDEDCLDEDCDLSVDYTEGAYDVCNEIIKRLNKKYGKGDHHETVQTQK